MASKIIKEDVQLPKDFQKCLAFVLYNVFSKEECEEYINIAEKKGFEVALLNAGGNRQVLATDIRNNSRCIWDTTEEVDKIWKRIKEYVPDVWCHREVMGLNERLRILRYDPGEYFRPHYDGMYERDNGERSYVTVQIYLNEGFKGGSTTFLGNYTEERVEVVPKTGSVLVFEHPILHEGSELIAGRKYAIRTDVMYSSKISKPKKATDSETIASESDTQISQNTETVQSSDNTKTKSNFLSELFG
ncbi:uncharacterized protein LOC127702908 [Mytilus californianus]|uniref:uncharacterized protein LOC127702908 n=1 Tax=Mytilus californianus TaxID=6549 RepID=UPI0022466001|nr:uncharacterized protein LOC127702908 [Mytilus californianus]XP_052063184.1 uncharacterized protein LOC127702908 [Mytilus californianus]XP_052063192.1 uncharacterized protein LOC127702908 [Mytilus californianus]